MGTTALRRHICPCHGQTKRNGWRIGGARRTKVSSSHPCRRLLACDGGDAGANGRASSVPGSSRTGHDGVLAVSGHQAPGKPTGRAARRSAGRYRSLSPPPSRPPSPLRPAGVGEDAAPRPERCQGCSGVPAGVRRQCGCRLRAPCVPHLAHSAAGRRLPPSRRLLRAPRPPPDGVARLPSEADDDAPGFVRYAIAAARTAHYVAPSHERTRRAATHVFLRELVAAECALHRARAPRPALASSGSVRRPPGTPAE